MVGRARLLGREETLISNVHPISAQTQLTMLYRWYIMNPDKDPVRKG